MNKHIADSDSEKTFLVSSVPQSVELQNDNKLKYLLLIVSLSRETNTLSVVQVTTKGVESRICTYYTRILILQIKYV